MSPSWCVIASKQAEPSWLYALKLADNFSSIKKLILLANSAVQWNEYTGKMKRRAIMYFVEMRPNSS